MDINDWPNEFGFKPVRGDLQDKINNLEATNKQLKNDKTVLRSENNFLKSEFQALVRLLMQNPECEYLHWPNRAEMLKDLAIKLNVHTGD